MAIATSLKPEAPALVVAVAIVAALAVLSWAMVGGRAAGGLLAGAVLVAVDACLVAWGGSHLVDLQASQDEQVSQGKGAPSDIQMKRFGPWVWLAAGAKLPVVLGGGYLAVVPLDLDRRFFCAGVMIGMAATVGVILLSVRRAGRQRRQ